MPRFAMANRGNESEKLSGDVITHVTAAINDDSTSASICNSSNPL